MPVLLTIAAVILAVWGIGQMFAGDWLWGLVLLVAACAVGPGGWTVYRRR